MQLHFNKKLELRKEESAAWCKQLTSTTVIEKLQIQHCFGDIKKKKR